MYGSTHHSFMKRASSASHFRSKNKDVPHRPVFVKGAQWNSRKLRIASCEVYGGRSHPDGDRCRAHIVLARLRGTTCYGCVDKVSKSTSGSWRKMFLTQPPLEIWHSFQELPGRGNSYQGGLRLGDHCLWKLRRLRYGNEDGDVDDPSDGSEIDAPADEEE